jgi:capsule polysaccharide export protein KpsE/RkpR
MQSSEIFSTPATLAGSNDARSETSPGPRNPRRAESLRLFWANRRFLGQAAVLGFLLSVGIAFMVPKRFQATASLMPPDWEGSSLDSRLLGMAGPASMAGGALSALNGRSAGATFVGILQSRTVSDDLIGQFDLRDVYRIKSPDDLRKALQAHTEISEDRKSGIITITVTDANPGRAANLAQAYTIELNRLVGHLDVSSARREREFLEGQIKAVQKALGDSEIALSQFSSKNKTFDVAEQGKTMMTAAAQVQAQLIASEMELQGLRQIYADNNVKVRSADARVAELKRKLSELGGETGSADLPAESSLDLPYPSMRRFPFLGATYADLSREIKINEMVFELLTRQYELAKVEEARQLPTVKELDIPVAPQTKSFPPRTLIAILGTLLATLGASALIVGRQKWLDTDDQDPRKQLIQEILGSLPCPLSWRRAAHKF